MAFINGVASLWWLWLVIAIVGLWVGAYFLSRYFESRAFENMAVALVTGSIGIISLFLLIGSGFKYLFSYNEAVGFWVIAFVVVAGAAYLIYCQCSVLARRE